jgi:hypothetical protein
VEPALASQLCEQPLSLVRMLSGILYSAASDPLFQAESFQVQVVELAADLVDASTAAWSNCRTAAGQHAPMDVAVLTLTSQALAAVTVRAERYFDAAGATTTGTLSSATSMAQSVAEEAVRAAAPLGPSGVAAMAATASQLMSNCTQLDAVGLLVHTLLHAQQAHSVAGEQMSLSETNFRAYVQRSLVSEGVVLQLPSGQSVTFTAEVMAAYAAQLNALVTQDNLDAGVVVDGQAEMDVRVVNVAARWSTCRVATAHSSLTLIELTTPSGIPIDLAAFGADVIFTLPLSDNATDAAYNQALAARCPGDPAPALSDVVDASFTCSFYNTTSHEYSTQGCVSKGVQLRVNGTTTSILTCSCSHLTEFAALLAEAEGAGEDSRCKLDASAMYFAFLALYLCVGSVSLVQLLRIARHLSATKQWLMTTEHALIGAACFFRSLNMVMFLNQDLVSFRIQALLAGLPYVFISWIFTFVIMAWAAIFATAAYGKQAQSPFVRFQAPFVVFNTTISVALFGIFASMAFTTDLQLITKLNKAGILLTCSVQLFLAIFSGIFSALLVRTLLKTISHGPYARKLGAIALSLILSFALSAVVLLYTALGEGGGAGTAGHQRTLITSSLYWALDIVALLIVMSIFARSLTDAIKAKEAAGASSSSGGKSKGSAAKHVEHSRTSSQGAVSITRTKSTIPPSTKKGRNNSSSKHSPTSLMAGSLSRGVPAGGVGAMVEDHSSERSALASMASTASDAEGLSINPLHDATAHTKRSHRGPPPPPISPHEVELAPLTESSWMPAGQSLSTVTGSMARLRPHSHLGQSGLEDDSHLLAEEASTGADLSRPSLPPPPLPSSSSSQSCPHGTADEEDELPPPPPPARKLPPPPPAAAAAAGRKLPPPPPSAAAPAAAAAAGNGAQRSGGPPPPPSRR